MQDNGSRWGVKGSSEVSEGLSAVYRYEEKLNLGTTTLSGGDRLSYIGLSGGFGSITLGRVFSASYNHVGVLTDNGVASTNSSSTVRIGNTVSYSASTGPVSFQVDAQMESGNAESVDAAELGLSFDTGAATVGLAFRDKNTDKTKQSAIGFSIPVGGLNLYASHTRTKADAIAAGNSKIRCLTTINDKTTMFRVRNQDPGLTCAEHGLEDNNTTNKKHILADVISEGTKGRKEASTTKSVHAGVSGSLGDTGMSFAVNFSDYSANAGGNGENPWNANVSKSLGGGASLAFEYIDNDSKAMGEENQALVQLKVDF